LTASVERLLLTPLITMAIDIEGIIKHAQNAQEPNLVYHRYSDAELENKPTTQLKLAGLYPKQPGEVNVELFAEKIADVAYADLPPGVHALTQFAYEGKPVILISNRVDDFENDDELYSRFKFNVAHECGHVIMQNELYRQACDRAIRARMRSKVSPSHGEAAVRRRLTFYRENAGYRWYEWQASTAGAHLLMPPEHLRYVIGQQLTETATTAPTRFLSEYSLRFRIEQAVRSIFRVSKATAEIAVDRYFKARPLLLKQTVAAAKGHPDS